MGLESKILVVDDDAVMRSILMDMLLEEGYQSVYELESGEKVNQMVDEHHIDLALLDISMPGKDGLTLTRELRALHPELGIILVTGKSDDIDKVIGIEVGADDYLTKPVKLRELQARVKNLLQRVRRERRGDPIKSAELSSARLRVGRFELDADKHELCEASGDTKTLTHGEFEILSMLANRPGNVYSREQLLGAVSSREWSPFDRTIDVLIGRLRKKIEANPKEPSHLITVHGAGYKLIN